MRAPAPGRPAIDPSGATCVLPLGSPLDPPGTTTAAVPPPEADRVPSAATSRSVDLGPNSVADSNHTATIGTPIATATRRLFR
ncbi:hypothetical protein Pla163_26680 [Planctomycetes bacterium Pla163]|uniref:Uncharacterized protein n=1 Tax=Rohdeia mirabilis TaxID=2528008 RepID=A0A518D239_9BACT|nr:hypothetical protein Pla163_26680 [Planctomycetes bacterium Pla163]